MNTHVAQNSKPRKQLSDQLDRLDSILDTLSEALNGAVADAARDGTRLALKDAVIEILTEPALRSKLHHATMPEGVDEAPSKTASILTRAKARLANAAKSVGQWASNFAERCKTQVKCLARGTAEAVQAVRRFATMKHLALIGLGVGVTAAVVGFVAPHAVAAGVSGFCGGIAAVTLRIGGWTRRTMRALTAG